MSSLVPLGDRAFLRRFPTERAAVRWAEAVRNSGWDGVVDVVAAYSGVGVFADPDRVDLDDLAARLDALESADDDAPIGRQVEIPVFYDGADLDDVARRLGRSPEDVIEAHASTEYHVYALGFLPGFLYAGYLPESLTGLPRRDDPRPRVPAGSVAIVGRQTGVYPADSPGGWHLLGRTPVSTVDVAAGRFPVRVGDRLRFVAIDLEEFAGRLGEPLR